MLHEVLLLEKRSVHSVHWKHLLLSRDFPSGGSNNAITDIDFEVAEICHGWELYNKGTRGILLSLTIKDNLKRRSVNMSSEVASKIVATNPIGYRINLLPHFDIIYSFVGTHLKYTKIVVLKCIHVKTKPLFIASVSFKISYHSTNKMPYIYISMSSISYNDVVTWKYFRVNGPLCVEFAFHRWIPQQRPVTWSFDVFFDPRLKQQFSKQWCRRGFETLSHSLWRHCNA